MWTEFTREKPARRFLAAIVTCAALAAAVGLAWFISAARSEPTVGGFQSLPSWPIVFSLPQGVSWSRSGPERDETSPDGAFGSVAFEGRRSGLGVCLVLIGFQVLPASATAGEAMLEMTGQELSDGRPVMLGPLNGTMMEYSPRRGTRCLAAVACSDRGLALVVQYVAPEGSPNAGLIFQSVCRSIDYRRWWIKHGLDALSLFTDAAIRR